MEGRRKYRKEGGEGWRKEGEGCILATREDVKNRGNENGRRRGVKSGKEIENG